MWLSASWITLRPYLRNEIERMTNKFYTFMNYKKNKAGRRHGSTRVHSCLLHSKILHYFDIMTMITRIVVKR